MMTKILMAAIIMISMIVPTRAETVSLYASVDDSSSTINLLTDIMRNDPSYDPYNQFVALRSGDHEYRIYFGADLTKQSVCYTYTTSYMQNPASLIRSTVDSGLTVNKNGYLCVGNIAGSSASALADEYKTHTVLAVLAILFVILWIFHMFRRQRSSGDRYYRVR